MNACVLSKERPNGYLGMGAGSWVLKIELLLALERKGSKIAIFFKSKGTKDQSEFFKMFY
jgi:hypothetical protein